MPMPSTSAILNKSLRAVVSPHLRNAGFDVIDPRNALLWRDTSILVVKIRAVGHYFSEVTGWPPGSVSVWLGVFFTFGPQPAGIKRDTMGRPRPQEYHCHMRSQLECGISQAGQTSLRNPAEQRRTDIWWVEPDAPNANDVAVDIAAAMVTQGFPWFARASDLSTALTMVEASHDCFNKYVKAALIAKQIGDQERWAHYDKLAEQEARRIGHSLDRESWFGIG
jgi:hypothetical protein